MKKISILLIFILILSMSALSFAGEKQTVLSQEDVIKLVEQYGGEVLSPSEVEELNLQVKDNEKDFKTLEEIENSINDIKNRVEKLTSTTIISETNIKVNVEDVSEKLISRTVSSSGTNTEVTTVSRTWYQLDDLDYRAQASATYEYDYVQLPGEPPIISNLRWTDVSSPEVIDLDPGYYNRITNVRNQSVSIISDTKIDHDYTIDFDYYSFFNGVWFKVADDSMNGISRYHLDDYTIY